MNAFNTPTRPNEVKMTSENVLFMTIDDRVVNNNKQLTFVDEDEFSGIDK